MKKYYFPLITLIFSLSPLAAQQAPEVKTPQALRNFGNSCYLNATLQSFGALSHMNQIFAKNPYLYMSKQEPVRTTGWLSKVMSYVRAQSEPFMSLYSRVASQMEKNENPTGLQPLYQKTCTLFDQSGQQDATELMTKVIDQMTDPSSSEYDLSYIRRLFIKNYVSPLFSIETQSDLKHPDGRTRPQLPNAETTLNLPIPRGSQSLRDCLKHHFDQETLDTAIEWEEGKSKVPGCTKQTRIANAPAYLMLTLKRFTPAKNNTPIDMPLVNLNLKEWSTDNQNTDYELRSAVVHQGSTAHNGHYVAYVKYPNQKWYRCNDSSITPIEENEAQQNINSGYAFIYEKKNAQLPSVPTLYTSALKSTQTMEGPATWADQLEHIQKVQKEVPERSELNHMYSTLLDLD